MICAALWEGGGSSQQPRIQREPSIAQTYPGIDVLCCINHSTPSLGTGPSCFLGFPQTVLLVSPPFPLDSSVFTPAHLE